MKTYQIKEQKKNRITLLRHVSLPAENTLKEASVALEFCEVVVPEDLRVRAKSAESDAQGRRKHFEFCETPFQVKYRLVAGYDPATGVDVAGNPCNEKPEKNGEAGSNEEKEEWLNHARSERKSLGETKNGHLFLQAYDTYTDVYNAAIKTDAFGSVWKVDSVRDMAADTHTALNSDDAEINDKQYDVEGLPDPLSYNEYAFFMQAQLNYTLEAMKTQDGKPSGLNLPGPDYFDDETVDQSIDAIGRFIDAVSLTGNTQDGASVVMTRKQVYEAVDKNSPEDLPAANHRDRIAEEMRYYRERMECEQNGLELTEKDKYGREGFYRRLMNEKALRSADGKVLCEGVFSGVIPADGFEADIRYKEENGVLSDIVVSHINIPDLDFEVDSEKWDEAYRSALEEQFRNVSFVSRSVITVLREGIGQIVRKEAAKYETIRI